jgi:hypothetical protein
MTVQATSGDLTTTRSATHYFGEADDRLLTLPPAIGPTPMTVEATNPYVRTRLRYTPQPEYDSYYTSFFTQSIGGLVRQVTQNFSAGYLDGGAIDFTFPDFSGLAGWDNSWGLKPGTTITGSVIATGWTGQGTLAFLNPEVGSEILTASRVQIQIDP